jgi:small subunit ribosomal protein S1
MSENFAKLFEESLVGVEMRTGIIVAAKVIRIDQDFVTVDAGFKSEGVIPIEQFRDEHGALEIAVGDYVDVALDAIEDGSGETRLSREKAKRQAAWTTLSRAFEAGETVKGVMNGRVKGGFTVEMGSIRAFLPGSLVDIRPVRDPSYLEGKELDFKIIKLDQKRNNVVVSRRSVMEAENSVELQQLLDNLQEGQVITGVVKNLLDYGAFIDLGGIDGLLHNSDIAWERVKHPSEFLNIGDEIQVKVLKFDRDRTPPRVSLGLKQMDGDPWSDLQRRYPVGARLFGQVTNITDYGCFVKIEKGVEGLVHVSEMDWTNKNVHPSKVVKLGDEVEVMVLDIDAERRRISLGIKQCQANPWEEFASAFKKGDKVKGKIKSITDFGIFIGLNGNIDGLVHLSDISWTASGEEAVRNYKKGDEIEAVVIAIDPERERISLGIKQLDQDNFANFTSKYSKGSIVKGTVREVEAKSVVVTLEDEVDGRLRASEISLERVEDAREYLKVGDEVEAKITSIDRKNRVVNLSIKAKDSQNEDSSEQSKAQGGDDGGSSTLGDLFREQLEDKG